MARLDEHCDHVLVHTGQNYDYELNQVFFDDLGVRKPDHFLNGAGGTAAETIGNIIIAVDRVLEDEKPEAMLVLGDTNSCLAVIPAKRRKIPIFHMEAGNRCFDQRVPEETNRRIVDHTADVNLTYSSHRSRVSAARGPAAGPGHQDRQPDVRGADALSRSHRRIRCSVAAWSCPNINTSSSARTGKRTSTLPRTFRKLVAVLNAVAEDHGLPVIVSTHPRTMKRIEATGATFHDNVRLLKPLGFNDYVRLQLSARAVLSDSGTINEESSILNFPALNLREAHERPEGMEEAAVMMVGLEVDRVRQGLAILASQPRGSERSLRLVADYSMPNVSDKVLRIIHSYTDYVKRVVWREYD